MTATAVRTTPPAEIRTPDQRVRVFASSTMRELAAERQAVRDAVEALRLVPVMFELGARPHPPRQVYRSYLAQSQIFIGVYWQSYGRVAPGEQVSGLEEEYRLSAGMPRLIYVKSPAPERDPRLARLLDQVKADDTVSYQHFTDAAELQQLVEDDLAVLLSERFEQNEPGGDTPVSAALPAAATPTVAREQDTAAVAGLVAGQGARLVTLTGPGGVGKTRLAVAAADRLAPRFADGVRFVDLAPAAAADLVPGVIASRLGLRSAGDSVLADLLSYLRSRKILLVLDNFEQVTDAAPVLADLLAAAPGLVLLVTSRAVLRLRGEYEFPVAPLSVPPPGAGSDPGELARYAAVELFVQRARAVVPDFALTSANAQAVGEICRRLDGLPLAIELAAARIRLLPPRALLARLDGGLSVLADGPRDLPERQRTLRATLDWSFGLLSAEAQTLFTRLGVFAGSFDLPAAQAVSGPARGSTTGPGPDPDDAVPDGGLIDTLSALVDSSLVRPLASDDQPRFTLLDTVREYALERLRGTPDWTKVHQRHADYFRALAKPRDDELGGAGQLAWLQRLETGHDDLAAALSWLVETGQLGPAARLVWATGRFWWLHGHTGDIARHVGTFLAGADKLAPHDRALTLAGSGFVLSADGEQARAQPLFEASLPLFGHTRDAFGAAMTANALGHLLASQHQDEAASELLENTRRRLAAAGRRPLAGAPRILHLLTTALADNFLGQIRLRGGDPDQAVRLTGDGLAAARGAADRFTLLISLYDLALCRQAQGDLTGATALLTEGLSLADETGDRPSMGYYLEALAEVASRRDEAERAVSLLSAATMLLQASGRGWLHTYVPRAAHGDAALAALRGRTGEAAFEQAWTQGRAMDGAAAVRYARARP
jgi:predicted ATPase